MKLGGFEELVLLAIGSLGDDAYGVTIKEILKEKTGKNPSVGALHSALYRLEEKEFVKTREGGATAERGGRRKKYYQLTAYGLKMLQETNELRMSFAQNIPGLSIKTQE
ncbi:PadR family transcriptional regulator [Marinoscillum pacificum]|uniref:PadR family transcriptional regulator n=1 Tax=Marinoscillum pacificum TaxID=392723 RepID=UPI002158630C|nr:PadR family transcriptional regulator [Marinoscillum pacificum]